MRPNTLVVALALTAAATLLTMGPVAAAPRNTAADAAAVFDAKAPKVRQVALGVTRGAGSDMGDLDDYKQSVGGTAPASWTIFSSWGDPGSRAFPMSDAKGARSRGSAPMIWWRPFTPGDPTDCRYASFANIATGQHDGYVKAFAKDAKRYKRTVLLRFAPEANSGSKAWSMDKCGNDAATFVTAWRHVHDIFKDVGAKNVRFVWSVAKQNCNGACNPYAAFYPGDAYVDYMAFSGFNWGAERGVWLSMYDSFKWVTLRLTEISDRPIIAIEVACNPDGGDKAAWIRDGYPEVHELLPEIVAIVYLDVDLRGIGHPDWRIASPPEALTAYKEVLAQARFQGRFRGA